LLVHRIDACGRWSCVVKSVASSVTLQSNLTYEVLIREVNDESIDCDCAARHNRGAHNSRIGPDSGDSSHSSGACYRSGYTETAVVVDADGATIAAVRGDGAGIHTLDSAHDKAYSAVTFKSDTMALADRGKADGPITALGKLPHVLFFPGGVVIKLDNETIGAIGAAGAPGGNLDDGCAKAGLDKIRDRLK
jgi:uncharacterized protein GlcG (DUF336 family)